MTKIDFSDKMPLSENGRAKLFDFITNLVGVDVYNVGCTSYRDELVSNIDSEIHLEPIYLKLQHYCKHG